MSHPPDNTPAYAELHCVSNFSFLRGASHPEELVERATRLGYEALAITDECSLAGIVRAHVAAEEHGLKLIIGSEIQLTDGPRIVLLARNREGYGNLSALITEGRRRAEKGRYRLGRSELVDGLKGCLALLLPDYEDSDYEQARWLSKIFPGNLWIAAERHLGPDDHERLAHLRELAQLTGLPVVAASDVHMHARQRRALQDLLTAIRLGTTVEAAGQALFPNGERHLRSPASLGRIYPSEWLAETVEIAQRCHFRLDELRYEYPDDGLPEGETPAGYLRRLTDEGMRRHWPRGAPGHVRRQVEHELTVIAELAYEPYFLTVYDIVAYARSRGILCQGRGSAANSAVCFCLGITSVDPSRMQMLFERFVSKERNEPPDIDVDFEHERREEVIQYLYRRYGRERAALAATVITYRRRSALRDAGKALGLSLDQIDQLTKNTAWWDTGISKERIREAGLDPDSSLIERLLKLVAELTGFPRHLSQHVGGFVISRGPLSRLVPIENAAMPERTVIQWDKDDLDAVGLLKIDCLGLGMLSAIHRAFELLRRHRDLSPTLADVPAEDPAVYAMIQRADTVGVFQIESRAQMSMLPRLKPACFYDLVIEVAIVRPGPIQGQMVHPYLKRRRGLEPVTYPNEQVKEVLHRTLGVPIFQEQVIKLAMVAAGFTAGEADQLRRAIGSWRKRDTLERFRERLLEGMRARGYSGGFAEQIYRQIQGFGEYGFPESHAASFSLLVYVSAWLKRYHPEVFACALLNSQPMGFYGPSQLVQDAQRHDVEVRPVDVLHSDWDCTLEPSGEHDLALRLGLRMIRGLSREGAGRVIEVRRRQVIESVSDLARLAQLNRRDLDALAGADALASLAGHRHRARWEALDNQPETAMLAGSGAVESAPPLRKPIEGEDLVADYASLGLSLRRHPLSLLRTRFEAMGCVPARELGRLRHHQWVRTIGLVITRQHPASAGGTIFLTLEDETGTINLIVWQSITERFRLEILRGRLLLLEGRLQREEGVVHVVAEHLEDRTRMLGRLVTGSRDFC
jgi:error-prone DNA polymerase